MKTNLSPIIIFENHFDSTSREIIEFGAEKLFRLGYKTICIENDENMSVDKFIKNLETISNTEDSSYSRNVNQFLIIFAKSLVNMIVTARKVGFDIKFIDPQTHSGNLQDVITSSTVKEYGQKILNSVVWRDKIMAKKITEYSNLNSGGVITILGFCHGLIQNELNNISPLYICLRGIDSKLSDHHKNLDSKNPPDKLECKSYYEELTTEKFQKSLYSKGLSILEGKIGSEIEKLKYFDQMLNLITSDRGKYLDKSFEYNPTIIHYLNKLTGKNFTPKFREGITVMVDAILEISSNVEDINHYTKYMSEKFNLPFRNLIIKEQPYIVLHSINDNKIAEKILQEYKNIHKRKV